MDQVGYFRYVLFRMYYLFFIVMENLTCYSSEKVREKLDNSSGILIIIADVS